MALTALTRAPAGPRSPVARRGALACTVTATALALVGAALPAPKAVGIGDHLFPHLGNPGYDVRAYDISFDYSGDNSKPLTARTVIDAQVTAGPMDRFNLDFAAGDIRSVEVNGQRARYARAGEDLVVTPRAALRRGGHLHIEVRHTSDPTIKNGGWVRTDDGGLAMANQADAAHRVFPSNDHPADKAMFTFRVRAPQGLTAVAGGLPAGRASVGEDTVWTYRMRHPMATELAQVSIGRNTVVHSAGPHGLPLRHVVPTGQRKALEPVLNETSRQIVWMERRAGKYPFENYGLLVAEARTGFELETQTLSLFEQQLLSSRKYPDWYRESLMVHELAHQWYGNSVSPRRWTDLWLNEGHATWYEWAYAAERGGFSVETRARASYEQSDAWRKRYGPPAALLPARKSGKIQLFSPIVYNGSAVVLYALRERIGEQAFARLERLWPSLYRDSNATTADFIALAGRVSGQDQSAFLKKWLYGKTTPPMPGHPDWTQKKPAKVPTGRAGAGPARSLPGAGEHHHR
ncbi:M1 family metallopeptidase [Streptomyces spirodelae]|uniref:Aminopeptidase N n=1 Tax=Streptomyces spirodelae TaxID=2812904 RepID=A0ABS3X0Y8_9ACTN|nr:M1 family metallopeptidase [Streptomyces spirodelae]MBO8189053.1 M1 family metallopeptidase [Streptomyces spirodelae]